VKDLAASHNPDVKATLHCPLVVYVNKMPPVPHTLWTAASIRLLIVNGSRSDVAIEEPTPCDIFHWRLVNAEGRPIQSEPPELCPQHTVTLNLRAGTSVSKTETVQFDGTILEDSLRYTIEGRYWGYACEASFEVRVVV
jgi:hypothetical protein